ARTDPISSFLESVERAVLAHLVRREDAAVHYHIDAFGQALQGADGAADIERRVRILEARRREGTGEHDGLAGNAEQGARALRHGVGAVRDEHVRGIAVLDRGADALP